MLMCRTMAENVTTIEEVTDKFGSHYRVAGPSLDGCWQKLQRLGLLALSFRGHKDKLFKIHLSFKNAKDYFKPPVTSALKTLRIIMELDLNKFRSRLSSQLSSLVAGILCLKFTDDNVQSGELKVDKPYLDDLPTQAAPAARPHCLREIDLPLTWVYCFLAYVAVRTTDNDTRNMLTYARLLIQEAQGHCGPGWIEYDKCFRQQQAASTTPLPWNELNASLHAATVISLRLGATRACKLCCEPDHSEAQCALASLQPNMTPAPTVTPPARRAVRPETLERI